MSKIICFGNAKGGCGKTTLSCLSANTLSQAPFDFDVTVVDNDNQKSIVKARNFDVEDFSGVLPYDVLNYNIETLQGKISRLDERNDFVFIDAAGKLDNNLTVEQQEISKILVYTDYLFIPFVAGAFNLDSTIDYLRFALEIQEKRQSSERPLHIYGFLNRYRNRSKMNRHLLREVDELKRMTGIPFLRNYLNDYTLFSEVDTVSNFYKPDATDNATINFVVWFNEFYKIISE